MFDGCQVRKHYQRKWAEEEISVKQYGGTHGMRGRVYGLMASIIIER
jgi:hypothetical protein